MTIIKLEPVNGVHPVERQSHRTSNWMGEGWAEVPEHLAEQAYADALLVDHEYRLTLLELGLTAE